MQDKKIIRFKWTVEHDVNNNNKICRCYKNMIQCHKTTLNITLVSCLNCASKNSVPCYSLNVTASAIVVSLLLWLRRWKMRCGWNFPVGANKITFSLPGVMCRCISSPTFQEAYLRTRPQDILELLHFRADLTPNLERALHHFPIEDPHPERFCDKVVFVMGQKSRLLYLGIWQTTLRLFVHSGAHKMPIPRRTKPFGDRVDLRSA